MRKIFVLILVVGLLLSLVACSGNGAQAGAATSGAAASAAASSSAPASASAAAASSQGSSAKQPHIVLVNAIVGHPVYEQQAEAAREAAAEYNVKLDIIGPPMGDSDLVGTTVTNFDNAIAMDPDAIITEPWDPSFMASMSKIRQAGIPNFCTSNAPANADDYVAMIGTDNTKYGQTAAEMIAQKTGGKANVLIMFANLAAANQMEQAKGFEDAIAKNYPNIKVVAKDADNADASKAVTQFEQDFKAYPEIDVVLMLEGTGGPSAAQVAAEMNKKVLILDIDATDQTIANITKGTEWATLAQNFYKRGYESVRMAAEYLQNGNASSFNKDNDSGTVLIDSSNVANYKAVLQDAINKKGTPLK